MFFVVDCFLDELSGLLQTAVARRGSSFSREARNCGQSAAVKTKESISPRHDVQQVHLSDIIAAMICHCSCRVGQRNDSS